MNFPFRVPFDLRDIQEWVRQHRPLHVALNDSQYSWYAQLIGKCAKDIFGVPIRFLDAPASMV